MLLGPGPQINRPQLEPPAIGTSILGLVVQFGVHQYRGRDQCPLQCPLPPFGELFHEDKYDQQRVQRQ